MFINCHRKQGFKMFYKEMNEIADEMHSLNITVNSWAFKRNHIILLLSALAFASLNFSLKLWDLSTDQYMDPLFGPTWNSRNNSYELYITVKVCTQTVLTLMITKMVFFPVSFISASYYCWHMLSKFNKHFSEQVKKSARDAVLNIEMYRTTHLRLCELVSRANGLFYVMLGNMILNYIVVMLILLYLLATPSSRPGTVLEYITTSYWISFGAGFSTIYIIFSQQVYDEVSLTESLFMLYI